MATYVYRRNHRSDPRAGNGTDVRGPYWSLWRSKLPPAGTLTIGDHVVLLDHWRGDARLSWELAVDQAEHRRCETKAEAISAIASTFGLTEAEVSDDAYIAAKGDGPGVLLAWSGRPVRRLDLPRPTGLSVGRHGWAAVDEASALRWWDLDTSGRGPGDDGLADGDAIDEPPAPRVSLDDRQRTGAPQT